MAAAAPTAPAPPAAGATWEMGVAIAIVAVANLLCYLLNSRNALWRRSRCCAHVNTLLVSNRRPGVAVAQHATTWFAWDVIASKDVVGGGVLGAAGLTFLRAFEFIVFAFTTVYGNILYEAAGGEFFTYFTNWTFVLFGLTGLAGAGLSAREWARSRRPTLPCIEPAKRAAAAPGWHPLLRAYHLLLTTVCSASIMLTIFYWFADYIPGSALRFDNPVKHGASSLLLLVDVALSRLPVVSVHLQVVIAYGSAYLAFMWSFYAVTGRWVYRALDWSRPLSVAFYAALPLLLALGFSIMALVACLRELLARKCGGCCAGSRAQPEHADTTASLAMTPPPGLPALEVGAPRAGALQQQHHPHNSVAPYSPPSPRVAISLYGSSS